MTTKDNQRAIACAAAAVAEATVALDEARTRFDAQWRGGEPPRTLELLLGALEKTREALALVLELVAADNGIRIEVTRLRVTERRARR